MYRNHSVCDTDNVWTEENLISAKRLQFHGEQSDCVTFNQSRVNRRANWQAGSWKREARGREAWRDGSERRGEGRREEASKVIWPIPSLVFCLNPTNIKVRTFCTYLSFSFQTSVLARLCAIAIHIYLVSDTMCACVRYKWCHYW